MQSGAGMAVVAIVVLLSCDDYRDAVMVTESTGCHHSTAS